MPATVFLWRLTFSDGRQEIVAADSVRRTKVPGEIGIFFWNVSTGGRSELLEVGRMGPVALVERLGRESP
jgi:hypothetical protein